jgi:hypothetical protein
MTTILEPLRVASLTQLEAGQLIDQHIIDVDKIDAPTITDASVKIYFANIKTKQTAYRMGLSPIVKSTFTSKIAASDLVRDTDIEALFMAMDLGGLSDNAAEREAYNNLIVIKSSFKDLAILNYNSETLGIEKLVETLESSKFAADCNVLGLGKYITRLKNSNAKFKALFGDRLDETTGKENYDVKALRKTLFKEYGDFAKYVESQAKAPANVNNPEYATILDKLNTTRKYYADALARRVGTQEIPPPPATPTK